MEKPWWISKSWLTSPHPYFQVNVLKQCDGFIHRRGGCTGNPPLLDTWKLWCDNFLASSQAPHICIHNNTCTWLAKNRKGLGAFIMWMASGGHEVDVGGWGPTTKQCIGSSVQALYPSFGFQTLSWSKLPPPPPLHPPHIHSCDECSQAFPGLPLVYYYERKRKIKTGEAWKRG